MPSPAALRPSPDERAEAADDPTVPPDTGIQPLGSPPDAPPPEPDRAVLLGAPMPSDRLRGWLVTITLTLLAGLVRFAYLGSPTDSGTPVFDEKHYVPQAWQMLRNGGIEDNPGYELVVHPPLAKQLIALGEWIFGYDSVGWRSASALAGTLTVLLVIRAGRRLTRSTVLGGLAGLLLICDGLSHVQSRMGMLDAFSALFVAAAFATVLCDRDEVRARMAVVVAEGRVAASVHGPRWGFRWWRLTTGVLLGLGCGVKWSGVYWLVTFAGLTLIWDYTTRRTAGVARPLRGTLRRDLAPALWSLLIIPIGVYLACWWAWFGSETAIDRYAVGEQVGTGGPWSFLPDGLRSLWYFSSKVLAFHAGLTTQSAGVHPWESKPWTWPMGLRPMLYHYQGDVPGCGADSCVSAVMLVGTPALWWPAPLVLGYSLWQLITRHDWRYGAVLAGYGAGIVPWFIDMSRQMYFFYMAPVVPFLVLATAMVIGEILGPADAPRERRQTGLLAAGLWVGLIAANFVWLWPILTGTPITPEMWQAELWLPSWR